MNIILLWHCLWWIQFFPIEKFGISHIIRYNQLSELIYWSSNSKCLWVLKFHYFLPLVQVVQSEEGVCRAQEGSIFGHIWWSHSPLPWPPCQSQWLHPVWPGEGQNEGFYQVWVRWDFYFIPFVIFHYGSFLTRCGHGSKSSCLLWLLIVSKSQN